MTPLEEMKQVPRLQSSIFQLVKRLMVMASERNLHDVSRLQEFVLFAVRIIMIHDVDAGLIPGTIDGVISNQREVCVP